MKHWDGQEIRALALEKVLKPLWLRRGEFLPKGESSPLALLPISLDLVVTKLLGLRLEIPPEIIPDAGPHPLAGYQIAGLLDRELGRIVIAEKFPIACRRYTGFHEVGHHFLHPEVMYHRDRPVIGSERADVRGRPRVEIEADTFSAEVLMPRQLVLDLFLKRYGGTMSPDKIDETVAYRLSKRAEQELTVDMLVKGPRRGRSRLFAMDSLPGRSLTEIFLVSPAAMAIRLEELGLVL